MHAHPTIIKNADQILLCTLQSQAGYVFILAVPEFEKVKLAELSDER